MRIGCATVSRLPVIPDTVRVFQDAGVFQHATGLCAIFEERGTVLIHRNGSAEAVLHHGNWRKTNQTIEAQPRYMENLVSAKVDILVLLSRNFICVCIVDIVEFTALVSVHFDILRQKRIQAQHCVLAIPDDLRIGIAPEEQVGHQGFPEHK